jgi:hypothetical protein
MRKITRAIAAVMMALFALMFWAQMGVIATNVAVARSKTGSFAVPSNRYLPIQMFEPVY